MSKEEEQLNFHVFHTWKSAFNSRDIDKMVSLLTDNIKINSISFGDYKGKKGARDLWQFGLEQKIPFARSICL